MREIDRAATAAAADEKLLNTFISDNKRLIADCAFRTSKRYITENDDEWSVALIAFSDAVKTYNYDKGSFVSYADTAIRRRLIDYFRYQGKHNAELSVDPSVFDSEPEEDDEQLSLKLAVAGKLVQLSYNPVKDEIDAANEEFRLYGFSFFDLTGCSPKSNKTRKACRTAVLYLLNNDEAAAEMRRTKQLPIKKIHDFTEVPRKLLERHRKYIIAAEVMLSGEYPCLAEYVSYIRKDGGS